MNNEILALIDILIDEKINDLPIIQGKRGLRGKTGPQGEKGLTGSPGKDATFDFNNYKDEIYKYILDNIPKFENLTDEQKESLRGQRGMRGQRGKPGLDGKDGKDFIWDDYKHIIFDIIESHKLKFEDFTEEERELLKGERGPRGLRGQKGKEGPKGEKGEDGKSFSWEEYAENITKIIQDNKLKFSDLTEEDKQAIRGPRGLRGQKGKAGNDGLSAFEIWQKNNKGNESDFLKSLIGKTGTPGLQGLTGPQGINGLDGRDGEDGLDAPFITKVKLDSTGKNEFRFIFFFSDNTTLKTNSIKIKAESIVQQLVAAGGGGQRIYRSTEIEYNQNLTSVVKDFINDDKTLLGRKSEFFYNGSFMDYNLITLYSAEGNDENFPNKIIVQERFDYVYDMGKLIDVKVTQQ